MPSHSEEDWSDTDDELQAGEDVETAVLLGIPDGSITDSADLVDAAVSRLGGRPVRIFIISLPYLTPVLLSFIRIKCLFVSFLFSFEGIRSERNSKY